MTDVSDLDATIAALGQQIEESFDAIIAQRDAARAELRAHAAENERLQTQLEAATKIGRAAGKLLAEKMTEIGRLRSALSDIANLPEDSPDLRRIARAALGKDEA